MNDQKPLSVSRIGYGLAVIGGIAALPFGLVVSPLVLLLIAKFISADSKPVGLRWIVWAALGIPLVPILWLFNSALLVSIKTSRMSIGEYRELKRNADSIVRIRAQGCSIEMAIANLKPDHVFGSANCSASGGFFESNEPRLRVQAQVRVSPEGEVELVRKAE